LSRARAAPPAHRRLPRHLPYSAAHWKELVGSRLQERAVAARRSRAAPLADERAVARRIKDRPRADRAASGSS
jgi:hypothetical protein